MLQGLSGVDKPLTCLSDCPSHVKVLAKYALKLPTRCPVQEQRLMSPKQGVISADHYALTAGTFRELFSKGSLSQEKVLSVCLSGEGESYRKNPTPQLV